MSTIKEQNEWLYIFEANYSIWLELVIRELGYNNIKLQCSKPYSFYVKHFNENTTIALYNCIQNEDKWDIKLDTIIAQI